MKHRVMYEVNLHVTPLSVRNVTTDLLVRKVRGLQFSGNARFGKESLRYTQARLLQTTVD